MSIFVARAVGVRILRDMNTTQTKTIHALYRAVLVADDRFAEAVKAAYGSYHARFRPSFKGEPAVQAAYEAWRAAEAEYESALKD